MRVPGGALRCGVARTSAVAAALVVISVAAGGGTDAFAQTVPDSRVAVSVTGGYQLTTRSFTQTVTFEQYSEEGSLTATYATGRRPVLEAGVIVRLWRSFGVGVSASYLRDSGS